MDWIKAKNITIISFLILNIVLGLLIYKEKKKYVLSSDQCDIIYSLLDKNNVIYRDKFLIKNYSPMKQVNISFINFNLDDIINIFVQDRESLIKDYSQINSTFYNKIEKLTFLNNNRVLYEVKKNKKIQTCYDEEKVANSIISRMGKTGQKFIKDKSLVNDGKIILEYREKYKNYIIYDNYIVFIFNSYGLESIEYQYNDVIGFLGNSREIPSSNEVMLNFMQEVKNIYPDEIIEINDMDLIYTKINSTDLDSTNFILVPFYRIDYSVQYLNKNISRIMIINAYTNIKS